MAFGNIRIGISGWRYAPWRGRFYPEGLRQKDELAFAASKFPAIEINGTFYSLQSPKSFQAWAEETPGDFVSAVKGPRFITHMLKLKNVETPLANFCANGILGLGPKLGPVLWQFPPNFRFNPDKLEAFFKLLPRDTEAASRLARKHDHRVDGRTHFTIDRKRRLRHAVEIRHGSFLRAGIRRAVAPAQYRPGLRRYGRVASDDGCDRRLRLLPAARVGAALYQRL